MKPSVILFVLGCTLAAHASQAAVYRTVIPKQSVIGFEFRQMGVGVKGGFRRFTTQMAFDPAQPEAGRATIEIDLASIDAGSAEANTESAGKLWFNRSVFPKARFVSSQIHALGNNRYEMRGLLTIKGKSQEISVPVSYKPGNGVATFTGGFILHRLDFDIGEGMWADLDTVANEVKVTFRLAATGK